MAGATGWHADGSNESSPIVDPAWIAAHRSDANVRLVELDVSRAAYDAGHIPGAVFWSAYSDLRDGDYVADPAIALLDVRSPLEYDGERFWPSGATADAGRAGRVPGAISVPIDLLRTEDDTFREIEEMRRALERADVTREQRVITYRTIGNRASQAWFAMRYLLGYRHVSMYYASWAEWGKTEGTPIES
jgi:3-mercaptopyruvate sulfurtransferase SseA